MPECSWRISQDFTVRTDWRRNWQSVRWSLWPMRSFRQRLCAVPWKWTWQWAIFILKLPLTGENRYFKNLTMTWLWYCITLILRWLLLRHYKPVSVCRNGIPPYNWADITENITYPQTWMVKVLPLCLVIPIIDNKGLELTDHQKGEVFLDC